MGAPPEASTYPQLLLTGRGHEALLLLRARRGREPGADLGPPFLLFVLGRGGHGGKSWLAFEQFKV